MKGMNGLSKLQWIQWLSATLVAAVVIAVSQTTYIHTTFAKITQLMSLKEEINHQRERDVDLILDRLDGLEQKVDRLIERGER